MNVLYVVATPIGNLEDITLRALRVLKEANMIAAEDTRRAKKLLVKYEISTPVTSFHEHSTNAKMHRLIEFIKTEGDLALISDAGMPGISDPGYGLISESISNDIKVVPIPGPSAVTTALVMSSLPADNFTFIGFLPKKKSDRLRFISSIARNKQTMVAFESPHRLQSSLKDLSEILGQRRIAICRELTKVHEEIWHGTFEEAIRHFLKPRGEFTLVIEGDTNPETIITTIELRSILARFKETGLTSKDAITQAVQAYGVSRKLAYRTWLDLSIVEKG